MAKVEFRTKSGQLVRFQATGKRARGEKRALTDHNVFMSGRLSYWLSQGDDNITAFKKATQEWKMDKKTADPIPKVRLGALIAQVTKPQSAKQQSAKQQKPKAQAQKPVRQQIPKVQLAALIAQVSKPAARKSRDPLAQLKKRKSADRAKKQARHQRAAARAKKRAA